MINELRKVWNLIIHHISNIFAGISQHWKKLEMVKNVIEGVSADMA